jgi:MFS family permease
VWIVEGTGRESIGYGSLVRGNANYRRLWFGQIISQLGDWFTLVAGATLAAMLTKSSLAVGALFVIRLLAPFLVSPFAGIVADQFSRKRILIFCDLARAVTILGLLFVKEPEHVWLLYGLTCAQFGISGFFFPTRNAMLPDIVSKHELGTANALSSATWSVMLALGAALGGLVSGVLGLDYAFLLDSLTFLLSACFIAKINLVRFPCPRVRVRTFAEGLQQYIGGWHFLMDRQDFLFISLHKAVLGLLLGSSFDIVEVAAAERIFVIGIGGGVGLGLLFSAEGIGTGVGPLAARFITGDHQQSIRKAITAGYLLGGLGLAAFAPLSGFSLGIAAMFVRGIGSGTVWVFSTQLLMSLVPPEMRGRVFAMEMAFFSLAAAIGAGLAGALLDTSLGISGTAWLMAFLTLIPAALWRMWNRKQRVVQQRLSDWTPI